MLGIMDTLKKPNGIPPPEFENFLREKRLSLGLSQKRLADMVGITRQAVAAIEGGHYSPATSVALQLARALRCRVEDLFSIRQGGEIIEGELLGSLPKGRDKLRARVTQVGGRLLVRSLDGTGELTSLTASADALILDRDLKGTRVKVRLLKNREAIQRQVAFAGCDPAMFLAAEHLAKRGREFLIPHLMGNASALAALRRGEVHAAGVHLVDESSGDRNLPDLSSVLDDMNVSIVTFAHWEEGFIVRPGNPRRIRAIADLARPRVRLINREKGSGARRLLDRELQSAGIPSARVKGYRDEVSSHLEVAARVKSGVADAGIGVRSAATICGLDFIPVQRERYDLIIPRTHLQTLDGLRALLDLIVSRTFRDELEALGGYDTRDSGKLVEFPQ